MTPEELDYALKDEYYVLDPSGRTLTWVMIFEGLDIREQELIERCPYYGNQSFQIRKHPCVRKDSRFYQLTEQIRDWLELVGYRYQFDYRWLEFKQGWCVGFKDPKQAAHFKLAWNHQ